MEMYNHGDDCYFFYYSSCSKGDSCPFRHCEAAIGNETVCNLWEEGRCFRPICQFRHMKITHNRKEISCYWENQPAGCQKPHCAFFHEKPRCIDGLYVPPDKGVKKSEEVPQVEPVSSQPILSTATNPQFRWVKKSESEEPVPRPTHPPVVINRADDDEDEDDQFSEEGEVGVPPRKQPGAVSMNFGVSTLGVIHLRKALKASMKTDLYSFPGADTSTDVCKENIPSSFKQMRDDFGDGVPLRRSLAQRLGRVVDEDQPTLLSQKSSKSVKQRLTLPSDLIAATQSVKTRPEKPEQIRIKTLEKIKLEKAAKSQNPKESSESEIAITQTVTTKNSKGVKRAIAVNENSVSNVRTFSEMLHVKKKRRRENQNQNKRLSEINKDKSQDKAEGVGSLAKESTGEIRVKTLEEIQWEKAARVQAQEDIQQTATTEPQESIAKKPRLLHLKKTASMSKDISPKSEIVTERPEKPLKSSYTLPEPSSNSIKVKTFEKIMRKKCLHKNVTKEPDTTSSQNNTSAEISPVTVTSAGTDTKVRPKLNLKQSVVKLSSHLKPGQKRKAPERSAVAAVKPLNSTSKEPESEAVCTDSQVFLSISPDSTQSSNFLCNPVSYSDSACKPQEPLAPDASTVTPSCKLAKSQRTSVAVNRVSGFRTPTSAVDDFDELISEFTTDNPLEDSVDLGLGEDDLLQELYNMIG